MNTLCHTVLKDCLQRVCKLLRNELSWRKEMICKGDNSRISIVSFRISLLFILHSKCLVTFLMSWYKVATSSTFIVFDVAILMTTPLAMWAIHIKAKKETLLLQ